MRETGAEVIAWCRDQQDNPTVDWTFHCLGMVGSAWAVLPVDGAGSWPNAWNAWTRSTQHHPEEVPPPGALVYWQVYARGSDGVRRNYGHVAVADFELGWCWSIDIKRHGCVDLVPISLISTSWGPYVGWSSDLEGVALPLGLYPAPHPPPPPSPPSGDDMITVIYLSTNAPDGADEQTIADLRWAFADFIGEFDPQTGVGRKAEHLTGSYKDQLVVAGVYNRIPKQNRNEQTGYYSIRLEGALPEEISLGGPKAWSKADFRAADDA